MLLGEKSVGNLLILSQVILSFQLPFAVVPLVIFTSSRRIMGDFVNPLWLQILSWIATSIIIILNLSLLKQFIWHK
jgi:manganese transport protein